MSEAIRKTKTPKGELRWVIITGEGKEDLQGNLKYSASILLDDRLRLTHAKKVIRAATRAA